MTVGSKIEDYKVTAQLAANRYAIVDNEDAIEVGRQLGKPAPPEYLSPRSQSHARPRSLSATYGLSAFPWHTDGAISANPPRWLILRGIDLSEPTHTAILAPRDDLLTTLRRTVLKAASRERATRYLPAVITKPNGGYRLRWDPRICPPTRGATADEVECHEPTARIEWNVGRLLVIDNAYALHRRPAVSESATRLIERTYVWERVKNVEF